MPVLSRVLGVATAGFGVLELAKPDLYGKAAGLGPSSRALRAFHHSLGARDLAIGLAMTFAPPGGPLRAATAMRILSDVTDAVSFGINAPTTTKKLQSIGVALGYGALCAASLKGAGK